MLDRYAATPLMSVLFEKEILLGMAKRWLCPSDVYRLVLAAKHPFFTGYFTDATDESVQAIHRSSLAQKSDLQGRESSQQWSQQKP